MTGILEALATLIFLCGCILLGLAIIKMVSIILRKKQNGRRKPEQRTDEPKPGVQSD